MKGSGGGKVLRAVCVAAAVAWSGFHVPAAAEPLKNGESRVSAYYFHGSARCYNCLRIEQYAREALEKYFPAELAAGTLVYRVVDVEEKGNEHFIKDYQLYTKSLVLSLVKDGREVRSENLVKVWEFLGARNKFHDYVKNRVDAFLSELSQ